MAAMVDRKIDVVVKIKREERKKDEPPKLHTDLPASMTFQQLLEQIVPDVSHITAKCRVGFKKRGEQIPTDFVEVELNDSIGKLNVAGSNFIDFRLKEEKNYEEQPPAKRSAFDVMMAASLVKELPPEISEKNSFDALYNQVLKVITSLNPMAGFNAGETKTTGTTSVFFFNIINKG